MKSTIKAALLIALFTSSVFADGEMGNGGRTCTTNCPTPAPLTYDATNSNEQEEESTKEQEESMLVFIKKYLESLFF